MARDRFVNPESVRLPLSGGDWLEVRRYLTTGEVQDMYAQMRASDGVTIDPAKAAIAKVIAYLVEWSFARASQPVPVSADAVRGLFLDDFAEVRDAVLAHEQAMGQALDEIKKSQAGETPSSAISESAA